MNITLVKINIVVYMSSDYSINYQYFARGSLGRWARSYGQVLDSVFLSVAKNLGLTQTRDSSHPFRKNLARVGTLGGWEAGVRPLILQYAQTITTLCALCVLRARGLFARPSILKYK